MILKESVQRTTPQHKDPPQHNLHPHTHNVSQQMTMKKQQQNHPLEKPWPLGGGKFTLVAKLHSNALAFVTLLLIG